MNVKVPVSVGELYDKISILQIKIEAAKNQIQKNNINKELSILLKISKKIEIPLHFKEQLYHVNKTIWDLEDDIRKCEKEKRFDKEFITLARMIYLYNDTRADVKKEINKYCNSEIVEEKIY